MLGRMLETLRTRLSPWELDDWRELRYIAKDPEVMRYIAEGQPWPDDRIQEFVSRQIGHFEARRFCMWKMTSREPGVAGVIGFCGIQPWLDTDEIEIGWWLARCCWGKGIATEAARAVLQDAFERRGLRRIIAIAQPANGASRRIMEKLGMRYERDTTSRGISVVLYAVEASK